MNWLRRKRTGKVQRVLDEIDLNILFMIENKRSVTMTELKKMTKLSWSNLQIHKNRLIPLINIERQKDNSKVVTLKDEAKPLVKLLGVFYG